jgi:hypothetical protein
MAVNDVVQQAVQQKADPELRQIGAAVPAFDDGADVQAVISACRVTKALSSLVASLPEAMSSRAP